MLLSAGMSDYMLRMETEAKAYSTFPVWRYEGRLPSLQLDRPLRGGVASQWPWPVLFPESLIQEGQGLNGVSVPGGGLKTNTIKQISNLTPHPP